MATQGLLSIVRDGRTLWKIVTGQDGYNIPKLAYLFAVDGVPSGVDDVYHFVTEGSGLFKPSVSLFVLGQCQWRGGEGDEALPELYGSTFHRPEFNPRWNLGTADYAMILDLDADVLRVVRSVEPVD